MEVVRKVNESNLQQRKYELRNKRKQKEKNTEKNTNKTETLKQIINFKNLS